MPTSPRERTKAALTSPHDALFKWTFSQREHAVGLLRAALPPEVVAAVRWGTLRVEKASFVDRALRSRHSDLVLSARIGKERLFFYTVLEHQRGVEALMVFRMGVYMMRLWEQLVRDRPALTQLPPILPVLIHHSETGWTAATAFHDLIAAGEGPARTALLPHLPSFSLCLLDVSGGRAEDLVTQTLTALGKVVMWCLSVAGDDARFAAEAGRLAVTLEEVLRAPDGFAALEPLLRYLVATHPRVSVEKVGQLLVNAAGPQVREAIVTTLDRIERRGELRGELRGRARGRAQTLLELLAVRFGAVPAEVSARVLAADEPALAAWTARLLVAPTLDEVLGDDGADRPPAPVRRRAARKRASRG